MKTFGLAGWSGSGKTTLAVNLLKELRKNKFTVSTIKHTHHKFDLDKPGKDSYSHREAGASEVMIASSTRWALLHELANKSEPDVKDLIRRMSPVDLILIEGFKSYLHPKLEIYRPSLNKPLLASHDSSIVAIASDGQLQNPIVPVFDLNDPVIITQFIIKYMRLES